MPRTRYLTLLAGATAITACADTVTSPVRAPVGGIQASTDGFCDPNAILPVDGCTLQDDPTDFDEVVSYVDQMPAEPGVQPLDLDAPNFAYSGSGDPAAEAENAGLPVCPAAAGYAINTFRFDSRVPARFPAWGTWTRQGYAFPGQRYARYRWPTGQYVISFVDQGVARSMDFWKGISINPDDPFEYYAHVEESDMQCDLTIENRGGTIVPKYKLTALKYYGLYFTSKRIYSDGGTGSGGPGDTGTSTSFASTGGTGGTGGGAPPNSDTALVEFTCEETIWEGGTYYLICRRV